MVHFLRVNDLKSKDQPLATLNKISLLQVDAVYIDFAKAFDSVSHDKLILKVKSYDSVCLDTDFH